MFLVVALAYGAGGLSKGPESDDGAGVSEIGLRDRDKDEKPVAVQFALAKADDDTAVPEATVGFVDAEVTLDAQLGTGKIMHVCAPMKHYILM